MGEFDSVAAQYNIKSDKRIEVVKHVIHNGSESARPGCMH